MASMVVVSLFAAIQVAFAAPPPTVDLFNLDYYPNTEYTEFYCHPYDPEPLPAPRTYLRIGVVVNNIVAPFNLSIWDIIVRWNPTVLEPNETCVYFNKNTYGPGMQNEPITSSVTVGFAKDWVMLGQVNNGIGEFLPNTVVAWIVLRIKYPGMSKIWIDWSSFYDDQFNHLPVTPSTPYEYPCLWWSHKPVPVFTHNATQHTLPQGTCKIDCNTVPVGNVVKFNATKSWDPDGFIVSWWFDFGDGTNSTSTAQAGQVQYHMYTKYSITPYNVVLRLTDNDGNVWQSNWYEQKGEHQVWLWRDIAIVDIWPEIVSVTNTVDYFWDWDEIQAETYELGKYGTFLITMPNYGHTKEFVHVELYAMRVNFWTGYKAGEFQMDGIVECYPIEEWLWYQGPLSGPGWGMVACWTPPKKGVYVIVAKVDLLPCTHDLEPGTYAGLKYDDFYGSSWFTDIWWGDPNGWTEKADPSENNFFAMPKPLFVFSNTTEYARWYCDVDKDGIVYLKDLTVWNKVWYKKNDVP